MTGKMDGMDADGEWSDDSEDGVKSGSATAHSENDVEDDPSANQQHTTMTTTNLMHKDPVHAILDKIDAELGAIQMSKKTPPKVAYKTKKTSVSQASRLKLEAEGVMFDTGDEMEKDKLAVPVTGSDRDTGLGTGSMQEETAQDTEHQRIVGSAQIYSDVAEMTDGDDGVQQPDDHHSDLDSIAAQQIDEKFKEIMRKKRGGYLEGLRAPVSASDVTSIKTEDFEEKFKATMVGNRKYVAASRPRNKKHHYQSYQLPRGLQVSFRVPQSTHKGPGDLPPHSKSVQASGQSPAKQRPAPSFSSFRMSAGFGSDFGSVKTEDFESRFQDLMVKQSGVGSKPAKSSPAKKVLPTMPSTFSLPKSESSHGILSRSSKESSITKTKTVYTPASEGTSNKVRSLSSSHFQERTSSTSSHLHDNRTSSSVDASNISRPRSVSPRLFSKQQGQRFPKDDVLYQPASNSPWGREFWHTEKVPTAASSATSTFDEVESLCLSKSSSSVDSIYQQRKSLDLANYTPFSAPTAYAENDWFNSKAFCNDIGYDDLDHYQGISSENIRSTDSLFRKVLGLKHMYPSSKVTKRQHEKIEQYSTSESSLSQKDGDRGKDLIIPDEEEEEYPFSKYKFNIKPDRTSLSYLGRSSSIQSIDSSRFSDIVSSAIDFARLSSAPAFCASSVSSDPWEVNSPSSHMQSQASSPPVPVYHEVTKSKHFSPDTSSLPPSTPPEIAAAPFTSYTAERMLSDLGFSGSDSFIPERFLRDWYNKLVQSSNNFPNRGGPITNVSPVPQDRQPIYNENVYHKYPEQNGESPLKSLRHQAVETTIQHISHPPRPGLMGRENFEHLRECLERVAAQPHHPEVPTSKKRKQWACSRQKSLPLCLETLTEDDEERSRMSLSRKKYHNFHQKKQDSLLSEVSSYEARSTSSESYNSPVYTNAEEPLFTSDSRSSKSETSSSEKLKNYRLLGTEDSMMSKSSIEVADIMENRCETKISAEKLVEPAMISIVLHDVDGNVTKERMPESLQCAKMNQSLDQTSDFLTVNMSRSSSITASPIPISPITVIEVGLDNANDSLDIDDSDNYLKLNDTLERRHSTGGMLKQKEHEKALKMEKRRNSLMSRKEIGNSDILMVPSMDSMEEEPLSIFTYRQNKTNYFDGRAKKEAFVQVDDGKLSPIMELPRTDNVFLYDDDDDIFYLTMDSATQCNLLPVKYLQENRNNVSLADKCVQVGGSGSKSEYDEDSCMRESLKWPNTVPFQAKHSDSSTQTFWETTELIAKASMDAAFTKHLDKDSKRTMLSRSRDNILLADINNKSKEISVFIDVPQHTLINEDRFSPSKGVVVSSVEESISDVCKDHDLDKNQFHALSTVNSVQIFNTDVKQISLEAVTEQKSSEESTYFDETFQSVDSKSFLNRLDDVTQKTAESEKIRENVCSEQQSMSFFTMPPDKQTERKGNVNNFSKNISEDEQVLQTNTSAGMLRKGSHLALPNSDKDSSCYSDQVDEEVDDVFFLTRTEEKSASVSPAVSLHDVDSLFSLLSEEGLTSVSDSNHLAVDSLPMLRPNSPLPRQLSDEDSSSFVSVSSFMSNSIVLRNGGIDGSQGCSDDDTFVVVNSDSRDNNISDNSMKNTMDEEGSLSRRCVSKENECQMSEQELNSELGSHSPYVLISADGVLYNQNNQLPCSGSTLESDFKSSVDVTGGMKCQKQRVTKNAFLTVCSFKNSKPTSPLRFSDVDSDFDELSALDHNKHKLPKILIKKDSNSISDELNLTEDDTTFSKHDQSSGNVINVDQQKIMNNLSAYFKPVWVDSPALSFTGSCDDLCSSTNKSEIKGNLSISDYNPFPNRSRSASCETNAIRVPIPMKRNSVPLAADEIVLNSKTVFISRRLAQNSPFTNPVKKHAVSKPSSNNQNNVPSTEGDKNATTDLSDKPKSSVHEFPISKKTNCDDISTSVDGAISKTVTDRTEQSITLSQSVEIHPVDADPVVTEPVKTPETVAKPVDIHKIKTQSENTDLKQQFKTIFLLHSSSLEDSNSDVYIDKNQHHTLPSVDSGQSLNTDVKQISSDLSYQGRTSDESPHFPKQGQVFQDVTKLNKQLLTPVTHSIAQNYLDLLGSQAENKTYPVSVENKMAQSFEDAQVMVTKSIVKQHDLGTETTKSQIIPDVMGQNSVFVRDEDCSNIRSAFSSADAARPADSKIENIKRKTVVGQNSQIMEDKGINVQDIRHMSDLHDGSDYISEQKTNVKSFRSGLTLFISENGSLGPVVVCSNQDPANSMTLLLDETSVRRSGKVENNSHDLSVEKTEQSDTTSANSVTSLLEKRKHIQNHSEQEEQLQNTKMNLTDTNFKVSGKRRYSTAENSKHFDEIKQKQDKIVSTRIYLENDDYTVHGFQKYFREINPEVDNVMTQKESNITEGSPQNRQHFVPVQKGELFETNPPYYHYTLPQAEMYSDARYRVPSSPVNTENMCYDKTEQREGYSTKTKHFHFDSQNTKHFHDQLIKQRDNYQSCHLESNLRSSCSEYNNPESATYLFSHSNQTSLVPNSESRLDESFLSSAKDNRQNLLIERSTKISVATETNENNSKSPPQYITQFDAGIPDTSSARRVSKEMYNPDVFEDRYSGNVMSREYGNKISDEHKLRTNTNTSQLIYYEENSSQFQDHEIKQLEVMTPHYDHNPVCTEGICLSYPPYSKTNKPSYNEDTFKNQPKVKFNEVQKPKSSVLHNTLCPPHSAPLQSVLSHESVERKSVMETGLKFHQSAEPGKDEIDNRRLPSRRNKHPLTLQADAETCERKKSFDLSDANSSSLDISDLFESSRQYLHSDSALYTQHEKQNKKSADDDSSAFLPLSSQFRKYNVRNKSPGVVEMKRKFESKVEENSGRRNVKFESEERNRHVANLKTVSVKQLANKFENH